MVITAIVRRDLLRHLRSPGRTALLFAMPLVIAGIFALVFGGGGGEDISIRILLFDEDQALLSRLLRGALENAGEQGSRVDVIEVGAEGYELMDAGDSASALLHIPAGFSKDFLDGKPTTLTVVKNPSQRFLPQLIQEGGSIAAVLLSETSRVLRSELEMVGAMTDENGVPADALVSNLGISINQKLRGAERYLFPPVVTLETVTLEDESKSAAGPSGVAAILSYFFPGLSFFAVLFLVQAATRDIIRDRESGLLRQLLSAPVTPRDYLVGKGLSVLLTALLGYLVMVVLGMLAGVRWGSPLPMAAMVLASSIAASGILLLVQSLLRTQRQSDAVTTIVIITWAVLGGAMVPLQQLPSFLLPVSRTTFTYWSVDGFNRLMFAAGSFADIALHLTVLAAGGTLLLGLGIRILGRRMAKGVV